MGKYISSNCGCEGWVNKEMFTSGGGLDDDPSDEPAVMPSKSHSDVVSESLSRVLGGDK